MIVLHCKTNSLMVTCTRFLADFHGSVIKAFIAARFHLKITKPLKSEYNLTSRDLN